MLLFFAPLLTATTKDGNFVVVEKTFQLKPVQTEQIFFATG